jgi:DNA polymerase IV
MDMDAFFAAIEQHDHPEYRGKPVVVGGPAEARGVVSTCSYEARRYGIHSAMPTAEARRRCPHAIFLTVRGRRYGEVSRQVMGILEQFTPLVEKVSVDEAFLDVTGCERLFGSAPEIARKIQERVLAETGLSCSLGVAPSRFLAKIGSDLRKPAGLVVVEPGQEEEFLRDLSLEKLWGVGEVTAQALRRLGLKTIGDLAAYPREILEQRFGDHGRRLHELAHGRDDSPLTFDAERKSLSAETTFARDISDPRELEAALLGLSERVGQRLRAEGLAGTTITLKLRFGDFRTLTRRETRREPTAEDLELYRTVRKLLAPHLGAGRQFRLLGVGVSSFTRSAQPTLFATPSPERPVDQALDRIRGKHGDEAIRRGRLVTKEKVDSGE